jgi:CubicO group peptidase (beta-lactamase class C family)
MRAHETAADRRQFLAALAALAATPSVAFASNSAVQAMINRYVAEKKVANMVVAVGHKTGAPQFFSAGTLELGAGAKAGPDSLYRIYSMSKCITGCAIMMLVQDGKLTLDTPLSDIFPGFAQMKVLTDPEKSLASKPATKPILIRHIVTHTSGLVYANTGTTPLAKFYDAAGINPGRGADPASRVPKTLIEFAELAAFAPLLFEPGSKWKYSIGLDVAGAVVEKVSGMAFDDFLAQRLFTPLGMADTFFTVPADKLSRLAANYKPTPSGALELSDPAGAKSDYARKPHFPSGGGGLVSSARNYSKFMAMLLNEGQLGKARILKAETAKLMMSNIMDAGTTATTVTYGHTGFGAGGRVAIEKTQFGEAPGTYGWNGAASTQASVDRANGIYTVLMTQVMAWPTNTLHKDVTAAAYAK